MAENKMEQYCKLPIPITAYQTDKEMNIETLEGVMHANVGDYIITGVNGEQYPCKPDIFAKTYIRYGQANKMEQIAAMFGKKLGEEFTVSVPQYDEYGELKNKVIVKGGFDDRGFSSEQIMFADAYIFAELLEGKAVIID